MVIVVPVFSIHPILLLLLRSLSKGNSRCCVRDNVAARHAFFGIGDTHVYLVVVIIRVEVMLVMMIPGRVDLI